jgi:CMP-N-acetylneuraminic acid synthetase
MIQPKPENTLAFIPCRTASKRLPRKNLMNLSGRPLVNHSIDFALKMGFKVVVAPDDEVVLYQLDKEYGNKITLFLREPDMADGNHQLESWAEAHDSVEASFKSANFTALAKYPYGVMFEPSSPLRNEQDVLLTLSKLNHFKSAGTVTRNERVRPDKLYMHTAGRYMGNLAGSFDMAGYPFKWEIVQFNGVCYAADRETILNCSLWDDMGTHIVEGVAFNIDTLEDFQVAQAYISMQEMRSELK